MSDKAIKAALREAAWAIRNDVELPEPVPILFASRVEARSALAARLAAAAVAAFLRALPTESAHEALAGTSYRGDPAHDSGHWHAKKLAAAVARAKGISDE